MVEQHSQQGQTQKTGKAPFGVAASPFNRVKMELGIAIIFGIVLWLVVDTITSSFGTQLLFLLGYGVVVSLWLVIRTRKILQQHKS